MPQSVTVHVVLRSTALRAGPGYLQLHICSYSPLTKPLSRVNPVIIGSSIDLEPTYTCSILLIVLQVPGGCRAGACVAVTAHGEDTHYRAGVERRRGKQAMIRYCLQHLGSCKRIVSAGPTSISTHAPPQASMVGDGAATSTPRVANEI